ncbi:MAG: ABC transporter ATP-binding protein [Acidobacteriota bacterium]|nr:ABC transporter ATP-binding protein [Acidobacteriota bacterium]
MTGTPVIQTHQLKKSYGSVEAVRGLNLSISANRITGFLGSNGAGKSTTIKMLLGMIRPTDGEGMVMGKRIDDPRESLHLRQQVAYVNEDKRLYNYMTVEQMIRFTSSFYPDWRAEQAKVLLKKYGLPPERRIKSLSKGMRTKLALLLAFSRRPALLILDEPSEGLDPHGVEQLLESLVTQCSEGAAVFFSTHQISEVERIADHVCILDRGRLAVDASLDELRDSYRQINLVFASLPAEREFQLDGVESVQTKGRQMAVFASRNADAIVERARDFHASSIEVAPVGLRDIFLQAAKEN